MMEELYQRWEDKTTYHKEAICTACYSVLQNKARSFKDMTF